jgi:hypothetical protein
MEPAELSWLLATALLLRVMADRNFALNAEARRLAALRNFI